MHNQDTKVDTQSIYHQQHQQKKDSKENRKHLLGLLSSFTREQDEVRNEEVEELGCYDRMKKLIYRNDHNISPQQQRDLGSAIAIEQKINQLEQQMNRRSENMSRNASPSKGPAVMHVDVSALSIQDVKKQCMQKYLSHKRVFKDKADQQIRREIEREVDERIDDIIEDKKNNFIQLREQNIVLRKQIMAKNLEIESLKSRESSMKDCIKELENTCKGKRESKRNANGNSRFYEIFYEKFTDAFGSMTVDDVHNSMQKSINKCLQQFDRVQNKNQQKMHELTKNMEYSNQKLQQKIAKLQTRENLLIISLKNVKLNKQITQVEANELWKAKGRLEQLQKLILSIYNSWYADRSQGQKRLMKCLGNLEESYSYKQMLKYIVDYGKKYSTNDKLNDYIFKLLRGVQKIKRIIYPDQCNEKLDALATMEKIQKWIKNKVSQHMRGPPKKRNIDTDENYLNDPL